MTVTAPHDLLEEREQLGAPLMAAIAVHMVLAAVIVVYTHIGSQAREPWGTPNSLGGGGSVLIDPVSKIALPNRSSRFNPVANDTQSLVPAAPKPEPAKQAVQEDPDVVRLKGREAKDRKTQQSAKQRYTPPDATRPGQIYSSTGAAASSDMYGATAAGSGSVGTTAGGPFGNRFGYYEQLLRQRVAQNWRTETIPLQTAPTVIVMFEIVRNGSIRNVRLLQRSGNPTLDYSCQRAIESAAPFPPLPQGFERDSAVIEFWFQLKR
jgi:protein TonB